MASPRRNPLGDNGDITTGTMTDTEGNEYQTVKIGNQEWMAENLRTTKYNDGTAISNVSDYTEWENLSTGAYCYYYNNVSNKEKYGALYNWYAVNTGKLAPAGWHVPTDAEWTELEEYLIANGYNWDGTTTVDNIAKSMAVKTDWDSSSYEGTPGNDMQSNNSSGFSALPGGYRLNNGYFSLQGTHGYWWGSTEGAVGDACRRKIRYDEDNLDEDDGNKEYGYSVRLVRD